MKQTELDDLAAELFDPDLPNIATVSVAGGPDFEGSISREHIETDEIVGVRSVLLAPNANLQGLRTGETIVIAGEDFIARVIEVRGRATTAVILGK